jgi:hypothetical protein
MGYGDQFNFQTHQFADPTAGLQQALGAGGLFATTLSNMVSNDKDQIQLARQGMEDQQRQQTFDNAQTLFKQGQDDKIIAANDAENRAEFLRRSLSVNHYTDPNSLSYDPKEQALASAQAISQGGGSLNNSAPFNDGKFILDADGNPILDQNGKYQVTRASQTGEDGKLNNLPADFNSYETNNKGEIVGSDAIGGKNLYAKHKDDGKWYGAANGVLVDNQNAVAPNVINDNTILAQNSTLRPDEPDNRFVVHSDGSVYQISSAIDPATGKPFAFDGSVPLNAENAAKVSKYDTYGNAYNTDATSKETAILQKLIADPVQKTIDNDKFKAANANDLQAIGDSMYGVGKSPAWLSTAVLTARASEAEADKIQKKDATDLQNELAKEEQALSAYNLTAQAKTDEIMLKEAAAKNGASPEAVNSLTSATTAGTKSENLYDKNVAANRTMLLEKLGANADQKYKDAVAAQYDELVGKGYIPDAVASVLYQHISEPQFTHEKGKPDKPQNTFTRIDPALLAGKQMTPEQLAQAQGLSVSSKVTKADTSAIFKTIIENNKNVTAQGAQPYYERIASLKQQLADVNKSDLTTHNQELQNNIDKTFADNNVSGYSDYKAAKTADALQKQLQSYGGVSTDPNAITDPNANAAGAGKGTNATVAKVAKSATEKAVNPFENDSAFGIYDDGPGRIDIGYGNSVKDVNAMLLSPKYKAYGLAPLPTDSSKEVRDYWSKLTPDQLAKYQSAVHDTNTKTIHSSTATAIDELSRNGIKVNDPKYTDVAAALASGFYQYGNGSAPIKKLVKDMSPFLIKDDYNGAIQVVKNNLYGKNPQSVVRANYLIKTLTMLDQTRPTDISKLQQTALGMYTDAHNADMTYNKSNIVDNGIMHVMKAGLYAQGKDSSATIASDNLDKAKEINDLRSQLRAANSQAVFAAASTNPNDLVLANDKVKSLQNKLSNIDKDTIRRNYNSFYYR